MFAPLVTALLLGLAAQSVNPSASASPSASAYRDPLWFSVAGTAQPVSPPPEPRRGLGHLRGAFRRSDGGNRGAGAAVPRVAPVTALMTAGTSRQPGRQAPRGYSAARKTQKRASRTRDCRRDFAVQCGRCRTHDPLPCCVFFRRVLPCCGHLSSRRLPQEARAQRMSLNDERAPLAHPGQPSLSRCEDGRSRDHLCRPFDLLHIDSPQAWLIR